MGGAVASMSATKFCKGCQERLPFSAFSTYRSHGVGNLIYRTRCRECTAEQSAKRWRETHPRGCSTESNHNTPYGLFLIKRMAEERKQRQWTLFRRSLGWCGKHERETIREGRGTLCFCPECMEEANAAILSFRQEWLKAGNEPVMAFESDKPSAIGSDTFLYYELGYPGLLNALV